jgi:signal transduction histidine kinase
VGAVVDKPAGGMSQPTSPMTRRPLRIQSSFSFWKTALGTLAAAVFSLLCQLPIVDDQSTLVGLNVVTTASMVGCGLLLLGDMRFAPWCHGLIICGLLWTARWSGVWDVGPLPVLSGFFNVWTYAAGGQALLDTPNRFASTRLDRALIWWIWIGATLTQGALVLTSRPEWVGFQSSIWWPGIFSSDDAFRWASAWAVGTNVSSTIVFVLVLMRRIGRMAGLDRIVSVPIYVGAAGLAGVATAVSGKQMLAIPEFDSMYGLLAAITISLPLAFVGAALLRRLEHATISQALHHAFANTQCDITDVEIALRETLRDPTLRLFVWNESIGAFFDDEHRIDTFRTPAPGRSLQELRAPNGECVALIDIDVALEHHPSLVATATQASAVALQNLRLHGDLEKRMEELQRSRARLVEAATEERTRIERDLHDGVQQRLLAVVARLGLLQRESDKPSSVALVKELSNEVRETLEDLRDLANGIHPPELRQFGLASAIEVVAERLPLEIKTDINPLRMSPTREITLYFVICEALTNVVKHASATKVDVATSVSGDEMILEVRDNGKGGADFTLGSGLTGCDDRVRSIGGQFEVERDANFGGTVIRARVPICE